MSDFANKEVHLASSGGETGLIDQTSYAVPNPLAALHHLHHQHEQEPQQPSEASSMTATTPAITQRISSSSSKNSHMIADLEEKKTVKEGVSPPEIGSNDDGMTEEERLRESKYLTGKKLAIVFVGMLMSVWLIALDQTILAPALPVIASKFNALDQIAWIASSYFLTQTAFLLLWGQILTLFDRKWAFLTGIVIFEAGSILCAASPDVNSLILGRAIAGVGASSIFVACLSIIAEVTRLEQRPKLFGLFGGVFALSSVIGPLLGGAFTDHVTWRLCFWINVPFGVITVAAIVFILGPQPPPPIEQNVVEFTQNKFRRWTFGKYNPAPESFIFRLGALDWIGCWLMLATITCLLLPLQWGGNKYPWSDKIIIGTFCAFGALVVLFVVYEWKFAGPTVILPLKFFRNRTQVGACLMAFFLMFCFLLSVYYLPIFFQATKGVSATKSGIDILPYMLGVVVGSGIAGGVISKEGHYKPWLVFGPWLICIGSGLFYTINENSPSAKLIGFQLIASLGTGFVLQNTIIAVQSDIKNPSDVPQATALVTFAQLVGGTIGISIASTIFGNKLASGLHEFAPDAPYDLVRNSVEAIKTIAKDLQPGVIHAYVLALNQVLVIGVASGALASLSALLIRNLSVKGQNLAAGAV